ncbi:unnamed protein product [Medioppia subpectinata]|uniref:BMERB domain-containing protein n=1 Tax=Medioppia subpectinata TaxID=1979941 RepID=A0A7R9LGM8_9ACAR|nr:unnamed protein product [Medioppia subpectinata]CAG2118676.1 unnamed protein product [Medioppia subpectinata]
MYMKREHRLEELQADIEYQMRCVLSKQAAQKTEEDLKQEEELLQRLVEIIEERNDIVEMMVRDENKEVEEYQKLISKVLPSKPELRPKPKQTVNTERGAAAADTTAGTNGRQPVSKKALKEELKMKEKLRLKDIKERKRLKKLEKSQQKDNKTDDRTATAGAADGHHPVVAADKVADKSMAKHLTLKSLKPLKRLGLKSLTGGSSDSGGKKSDKTTASASTLTPTNPTAKPQPLVTDNPVLTNGSPQT